MGNTFDMRARRWPLTLVFVVCVAATVLASCGNNAGGNNGPERVSVTTAKTTDASARFRKIDIRVGDKPGAMVFAYGSVWLLLSGDDPALLRLDPKARDVTATLPLDGNPIDMAASHGFLWVVDNYADGDLLKIDPKSNRVLDTIDLPVGTSGIAADDAAVWVVNDAPGYNDEYTVADNALTRVDTTSGNVRQAELGFTPDAVALSNGKLWITRYGARDNVATDVVGYRITNRIAEKGNSRAGVGRFLSAMSADESSVWVTDSADECSQGGVHILDASTLEGPFILLGDCPRDIALDDRGAWIVAAGDSSRVFRVDSRTRKVTASLRAGGNANDILPIDDDVWVSNLDDGTVTIFSVVNRNAG